MRPQNQNDAAFLRALYGSTRAEEMALVPWPAPMKAAFLDDQFRLQTVHFAQFHPLADYLIVEEAGQPIGRLYLDRRPDGFLVIDIAFLPHRRGGGLGAELLRHAHRRARRAGARRLWLHVSILNPRAQRLYERLGFRITAGADSDYRTMEWPVS